MTLCISTERIINMKTESILSAVNGSLEFQIGLHRMWAVGFGSIAHKTVVYQVFTTQKYDDRIDPVVAAYDGVSCHPRAVTASMILRGRGLSRIPVYGVFNRVEDAEKYADKLMSVVEKKTANNRNLFTTDPKSCTKKMWKELFRGLWSVEIPEWN